ncbi:MAG: SIS domain-containing protein [Clostridiales bacterium]|nr:SIS domain-containing protein [Clostridiales bacterium]
MRGYFSGLLASINKSVNSLDLETFERLVDIAVRVQIEGHKVVVSGLGKNVPICDKFVGTMLSLGLEASFMHSNTAIHGDLGMVRKGDLVIILTKSGSTAESVLLYDKLKAREVEIWLITFKGDSILGKSVPNVLTLQLEHEGDPWDMMPNNSTTVYLIILQALAIKTAEKLGIQLSQFAANHPGGAIGERLAK